jgi:hypothetical protein
MINYNGYDYYNFVCHFEGFDDQDMEKPHFSEPAPYPFVPLVLSDPGKQPVVQVITSHTGNNQSHR